MRAPVVFVEELEGLTAILRGRRPADWRLALTGLTGEENHRFERLIKKHRAACGCAEGAAAMFLSGIGYIGLLSLGNLHQSPRVVAEVVAGAGLMVLSAGLGKAIGLVWARRRLRQVIEQVRRRIGAPADPVQRERGHAGREA